MKVLIVACFVALICVQLSVGRVPRYRRDAETTEAAAPAAEPEQPELINTSPITIDDLGIAGLEALQANLEAMSAVQKLNDYGLADGAFIPNLPAILREKAGLEA